MVCIERLKRRLELLQATMIVFTSTSASIVFLSFGNLPYNYAAAVFVIGIVFTMLGQATPADFFCKLTFLGYSVAGYGN